MAPLFSDGCQQVGCLSSGDPEIDRRPSDRRRNSICPCALDQADGKADRKEKKHKHACEHATGPAPRGPKAVDRRETVNKGEKRALLRPSPRSGLEEKNFDVLDSSPFCLWRRRNGARPRTESALPKRNPVHRPRRRREEEAKKETLVAKIAKENTGETLCRQPPNGAGSIAPARQPHRRKEKKKKKIESTDDDTQTHARVSPRPCEIAA